MTRRLLVLIILLSTASWSEKPIRVLSLDGGGIKGIVEAVILSDIEYQLNKPIAEIFDLIAGSSTGGIIALGLVTPDETGKPLYSARDLLDVYTKHGNQVFHASLFHRLRTLNGMLGPKYESKSFKNLLNYYLGNTKLSQALIPTLITGYHVDGETGVEFFSEDARSFPTHVDCLMRDVGLATASAPTKFDTPDVELPCVVMHAVADGGLYKNNPALLAYANALKLFPNKKIEVYSLGTGKISTEEQTKDLTGRGLISWLPPIIYHCQIGDTEGDNVILHKLLNENSEENFFRLDIRLSRTHKKMDDISPQNINYLLTKAQEALGNPIYKSMLAKLKE